MQILGIGTTVVDRVVMMDCYPTVDTKKEILQSWTQVGGPVPVALSTAAALGQKTRLLSRWGNDFDGRYINDTLSDRSIDLTFTKTSANWQSGSAQVWLSQDSGSRTIAFSRGVFPPLNQSDVTDQLLDGCSILHLDGWASEAAITAAIRMKQREGTVVLDAGSVKPGLHKLLPHVDVVIASKLFCDAFEAATTSENTITKCDPSAAIQETASVKLNTAWSLLQLGPSTVITTNGADGATLHREDGPVFIDGRKVDCIDSNGAGDIFCGTILFGLTQNWPILKSIEFANEVAAQSCTRFGNQIPKDSFDKYAADQTPSHN